MPKTQDHADPAGGGAPCSLFRAESLAHRQKEHRPDTAENAVKWAKSPASRSILAGWRT